MKKLILLLAVLAVAGSATAQAVKTTLTDSAGVYTLRRGGAPYYIKGAAANNYHVQVAAYGGNTIRTYSINDSTGRWLDSADDHNITVCLGLGVKKLQEMNYADTAAVRLQFENMRSQVLAFKDHPALLMWAIGNETDANYNPLDTAYNIAYWDALNDIAEMIHETDTNHLTTCVLVNSDLKKIQLLKERFTHLDILSINSYAPNLPGVLGNLQTAGWTKPYMITEFGPRGTWQMNPEPKRKMPWGALVEQTSTEKAIVYRQAYLDYIAANAANNCLGGFVFVWGYQSAGDVVTWYGLYNRLGEAFGATDEMQYVWTGMYPSNRAPVIRTRDSLLFNGKRAEDTVIVEANTLNTGWVRASDPDNDSLRYEWLIIPENSNMAGGEPTASLPALPGLVVSQDADSARFMTPAAAGNYRLYVYVHDHRGKVANACIPFKVIPSSIGRLIRSTSTGGSWSLPTSWQGGVVPADADTAVIIAGSSITINTPVKVTRTEIAGTLGFNATTTHTFTTGDLVVENTGTFNARNGTIGRTVTVNGSLQNNGAADLSKANTILIMGPAAGSTVLGGTGAYANGIIRNLTINNDSGVVLQTPVSIPQVLTLAGGVFHNGSNLTMDNTKVGGSASSVNCQIRRSQHASLAGDYTLGTTAALYVVYNHDANAPAQLMTEGHEIPVSRSMHNITINNPDGVMISDSLTLKSSNAAITLTDGIIYLPAGKALICTNTSYNGAPGSSSSFVNGAVALTTGATPVTKTFPAGSGGQHRKVVLTGLASVSGAATVQLSIDTAAGTPGTGMGSLSTARRWHCAIRSGNLAGFTAISIGYGADDGAAQNRLAFSTTHAGTYDVIPTDTSTADAVTSSAGSYGAGWYTTGLNDSNTQLARKPAVVISREREAAAFIYPNPASDVIYVVCPQALKQKVHASLVDLRGNVVYYWALPQGQVRQTLPLPATTGSGVYLLVLEGAGFRQSLKVVIF
ncbi:T9SS type A sorting domain-containing protein [Chitinophaga sp. YIM B06452]|uniref:T9SS type A sorting domain-containing protein n=1 Tax=Chitinophaga sp. YIM B06452 TaxID=3082158 RepID=UPI0031FE863A